MKLDIHAGASAPILQIFIRDSSSTTGAGLTGLVFNSSGLTAYYHRNNDTAATAVSLVTMTVGTYTSGGLKEIDSTNMPGWYQFCPPVTSVAAGAPHVVFHLKGATNMAPLPFELEITAYNPYDAVALGLSSLPSATAGAIGGLPLAVTAGGGVNTTQLAGQTVTAGAGVTFPASVASPTNITAGTITTATNLTNAPTAGDFTAAMKVSLNAATPASITGAVGSVAGNVNGNVVGSVGSVTGGVTVSTNNDKTGYTLSAPGIAGVWNALTSGFVTSGSIGVLLAAGGSDTPGTTTLLTRIPGTVQPQSGDSFALLGTPAGASVSADIAQVEANVLGVPAAVLKLDWTTVSGEASRSTLNALRALRNKVTVLTGTLSVYKEDGTTVAFTEAVTTNPAAQPITEVSG